MRELMLYTNPLTSLVDSMFNDFFSDEDLINIPKADVLENKDNYNIKLDVPGFNENNLKVEVKNRYLTVSGTVEKNEEKKDERCIVKERSYGSFKREFLLPDDVDTENIDAKLENGVLNIIVKKSEKEKTKEIAIK